MAAPLRVTAALGALALAGWVPAVPASGAVAAAPRAASVLRLGAPVRVPADGVGTVTLRSVSCASPRRCEAVGQDAQGRDVTATGVEGRGRWTWSAARLGTGSAGDGTLAGISCAGVTGCVAAGRTAAGQAEVASGVAARAGLRWASPIVLEPDASGAGALEAVSCATRATCVVVGADASSQGIASVGTATGTTWSWTPVTTLSPDATGSGGLTSVSCGTASSCVAVGTDAAGVGIFAVGARGASGWSWAAATTIGPGVGALTGVSCASSSWCAAVGNAHGDPSTLSVGRRSGAAWGWTTSAVAGTVGGSIAGVACRTEQLCVAVGAGVVAGRAVALYALARMVGTAMATPGARPLPSIGAPASELDAVACAALDSCTAVGAGLGAGAVAAGSKAAPSPVRGVRVFAESGGALVAWRAPGFDGGASVASYRAMARPGGASCVVRADGGAAHCVVAHLVNGVRYRVTVTADNGVGVSPPASPRATVVPTPFQPPVASPLTAAVQGFVASRADVTSVTVYDVSTGQTWRVNPTSVQHTASIAKVEILAVLLHDEQVMHEAMSPATRELATEMIEDSDNDAAQTLYVAVGQEPGLAAFNALVGLTATTANWAWGFTDTTSLDQSRLVRLFAVPNAVLTDASRAFGLSLLRHVAPDQAWGVSAGPGGAASVALKNGWYPTGPGDWQVNSIGWVDGDGRDYVLAVLTKDNDEFDYGVTTIETISTMVWQGLAHRPAPAARAAQGRRR